MTQAEKVQMNPHELIFSLDIGTRNVVGIVGKMEGEKYTIIDTEILEHPSRAMYDGQIHDIDKVADVAKKVKENLEKRLNTELKYVAIAAAGRALKTYRIRIDQEIDVTKEIDKAMIDSLEIQGIQKAQDALNKEVDSKEPKYYCVGYTVVNYYLNDGMIMSLKGHRGNKMGADVLATFLPHVVVDSLYSVMHKVGLEVMNLTLEPIAAIHVAIPPKFRLLNLALIDIGAGTSDIAITQDGTIVAYAMASVAGDEITEALMQSYLLDFDTAEQLKISLNKKDVHTFVDIVGIPYTQSSQEIIEKVSEMIKKLAEEIADKVIAFNGKTPSAVFCIGGGSQVPTFTEHLADKLGLPKERVVVRGTEIIENIEFQCSKLEGPEFITPIGIGLIAVKDRQHDFLQVNVNGHMIKLFNTRQMFISDALVLIGYNARKLIARRGKNLEYTLNKEKKTVLGQPGEPARIYCNGKPCSLDTKIKNKDAIVVEEAADGKDAHVLLKDLVKNMKIVSLNGLDVTLVNHIFVNGEIRDLNYALKDGDVIEYTAIQSIEDMMKRFEIDHEKFNIYVNDVAVGTDYMLKNRDIIVTKPKKKTDENGNNCINELRVKDENIDQNHSQSKETVGGDEDIIEVTVNGEPKVFKRKNQQMIFVEIFNHIHFDRSRVKGILNLTLNGRRANYTDAIQHGDKIEIFWSK
ncbi:MAG: cell division protein FtsA [Bacillota bacterium]